MTKGRVEMPDNSTLLWRYMDFAKFSALLLTEKIFFCRADKFDDPYEFTVPISNKIEIEKTIKSYNNFGFIDPIAEMNLYSDKFQRSFNKDVRRWCYVSCWHANDSESAAMWELYGNLAQGIAIQTNFESLNNFVNIQNHKIRWGKVKYINFSDEPIDASDERNLCFYKRRSFAHESEIRGVIFELPPRPSGEDVSEIGKGLGLNYAAANDKSGVYAKIDLSAVVKNIYASPKSPDWFLEIVKKFSEKMGYKFNIKKSKLYSLD